MQGWTPSPLTGVCAVSVGVLPQRNKLESLVKYRLNMAVKNSQNNNQQACTAGIDPNNFIRYLNINNIMYVATGCALTSCVISGRKVSQDILPMC